MTKRFVALLGITILVLSLRTGAVAQNAIDVNGSWSMTSSGEAFANGQVKVRQDGSAVAGTYGQNGHFEGKFQPGTLKVDANLERLARHRLDDDRLFIRRKRLFRQVGTSRQ